MTGSSNAVVGSIYYFGDSIGYNINDCDLGYWPPGNICPVSPVGSAATQSFSLYPLKETSSRCYLPGRSTPVGRWVNGIAIYNAVNGESYNNQGSWRYITPIYEQNDYDICGGKPDASGIYSHRKFSKCLAQKTGDTGSDHSPVYGWMNDGFPIYGPYQSPYTVARSCWKTRTYTAASSTGCGSNYARSANCVPVNPYTFGIDKSKSSANAGPSTTSTVLSVEGYRISAASGLFFEDYYYDSTCTDVTGYTNYVYLDENNGHTHGDFGYHYHVTLDSFPYVAGPSFYGCAASTAGQVVTRYYLCVNFRIKKAIVVILLVVLVIIIFIINLINIIIAFIQY